MKKFVRNCPVCNVEITYKNKSHLNQATKENRKCRRVCSGIPDSPLHKICNKCKESKLFKEFTKHKINLDCLSFSCKICCNKANREHYKNNRKEIGAQKKEYRKNNLEEIRTQKKEYRKNNPEKGRTNNRRRRARKVAVNENYPASEELITREVFNHSCYNCNSTNNLAIDHHRPLSKGNALTLQNAVVLCKSCNSSKNTKNPEDFYGIEKCAELDLFLSTIE